MRKISSTRLNRLEAQLTTARTQHHKKGYIGLSPGEWDGLPDDWRIDRGRGYVAFRTPGDYERWLANEPV